MTKLGKCPICKLIGFLVIIGAVNWGFVGLAQVDLVARFLGDMTTASRVVYSFIGLAGLIAAFSCVKACPCCKTESCDTKK